MSGGVTFFNNPRKLSVIRTCNEWPLAYETKHQTFRKMKKNELDALEIVREMSLVNDRFQKTLRERREEAIALAEKLYPDAVNADMDFVHKGKTYNITHKKKWDFSHVTIDPIFNEWRAVVKEQKRLKGENDRLMKIILKRFPHLKPASETKVLSVKRADSRKKKGHRA